MKLDGEKLKHIAFIREQDDIGYRVLIFIL